MSSPSNGSNASSVATSPWRDSAQTPQQQQNHQPRSSPLATPASSFGPAPDTALLIQSSPLEPTPEAQAPDAEHTTTTTTTTTTAAAAASKSSSPANGFPLHSAQFSEDSSGDDGDGDGDAFGGAADDV